MEGRIGLICSIHGQMRIATKYLAQNLTASDQVTSWQVYTIAWGCSWIGRGSVAAAPDSRVQGSAT